MIDLGNVRYAGERLNVSKEEFYAELGVQVDGFLERGLSEHRLEMTAPPGLDNDRFLEELSRKLGERGYDSLKIRPLNSGIFSGNAGVIQAVWTVHGSRVLLTLTDTTR